MRSRLVYLLALVLSVMPSPVRAQIAVQQETVKGAVSGPDDMQHVTKVPKGVILVKGAWSSASDSVTPLPEDGNVTDSVFKDRYFGITWALPQHWTEGYKGPPPSESGRYVLAEIKTADAFKGPSGGSILITADDMFFTPFPEANSIEVVNHVKDNLQADYKVEKPPKQISIAGIPFTYFAYWSPAAELHWYILATQIRCHTVEIILSSTDTKLLDDVVQDLNNMKLTAEDSEADGKAVPICIKNYASEANVIERVDPIFGERRFNSIPVRVIIDKEGRIKHIHFLSAYPDQAKAIADALGQWRLKPFLRNGEPVEVETGILFGYAPRLASSSTQNSMPK